MNEFLSEWSNVCPRIDVVHCFTELSVCCFVSIKVCRHRSFSSSGVRWDARRGSSNASRSCKTVYTSSYLSVTDHRDCMHQGPPTPPATLCNRLDHWTTDGRLTWEITLVACPAKCDIGPMVGDDNSWQRLNNTYRRCQIQLETKY